MTQELMQRLGIQSPETAEKVEQFLLALEERNRLLTEKSAALEREKTLAEEALQNAKKIAAMEKAILEAGGKNAKAILALIDADEVTLNEKGELEGLDLEAVKAEAPYLFNEKEEKTKGTGFQVAYTKKKTTKENEIAQTFRKALRR
ncbi:phage scaffolding protein [Anaerotignum sp.]|uniref:phage scaffolding protein n=1 Tax=Anaerotignum sp. TaxID=2039241 RepID=UPI003AB6750B